MVRHQIREALGLGTIGIAALGIAVAAASFIVLMLLLLPGHFIRLVVGAFRRLVRTLTKTAIPPRLHAWNSAPQSPEAQLVLCQISDVHMTSRSHVPYELHGSPGAPDTLELRRRLSTVLTEANRLQPPAIALTGDLTDSGDEKEWEQFSAEIALHRTPGTTLILSPGNHDVQILIEHDREGRRRPISRADATLPNRAAICRRNLGEIEAGYGEFPVTTQIEVGGRRIEVISIDSCRYESNWLLSNAVGEIGQSQLNTLRARLSGSTNPTIIVLHHHVGWYEAHRRDARDVLMCAIDGRELLIILAEHAAESGAPVLVLHGHKHMCMRGVFRHHGTEVFVHGCPSSTLGNAATPWEAVDGHQYLAEIYLLGSRWEVVVRRLAGPPAVDSDSDVSDRLMEADTGA
jgi:predicted MPP superfamily phosphohydrolase